MIHFEYRDKRDKNGLLLKNAAYSLSHDFVDECIDILAKFEIYEKLMASFNKQYIEFYFRKMIFYEFLPIAHQLTIKQWDDQNNDNHGAISIDSSSFKCSELLQTICVKKNSNLSFEFKGSLSRFQKVKRKYKPLLKKILLFFNRFSYYGFINNQGMLSVDSIDSSRIAVYLSEGVDLDKRSNIFWLPDSNIDASSVLIYFSLDRKESKSTILKLNEHNLQWVNLRGWINKNKFQLGKNILDSIKNNNKPYNKTHKWLLNEATVLIGDINHWYSFFQQFNINIHSDNTEYGVETIVKQIALDELNGVSFVAQRSYPDPLKGKFYAYYPTDIFFTWGAHAAQKFKEIIFNHNNPNVNSILISGCHQVNKISENSLVYLENIKNKLSNNGAKTIIMFLDSNHESNSTWQRQSIDTKILAEIYISLLKMVIDNDEIALIIKPKKIQFFDSIRPIIANYLNKADQKGRLYISEGLGVRPSDFASISDLIVGVTSEYLPAAVIECVIMKKPAVIYDYAGLLSIDKDFYSWAYQKVIFDEIEVMMSEIKLFSKNGSKYSTFGEWSDYLDDFDPFQDNISYSRIGFYLNFLLKFFNSGIEKKVLLKMANEAYSTECGMDKVVLIDHSFSK